MKLYLEFIKIAFQARLAYKMDTFLRLLSGVIVVFVQIAIWRALLGAAGETTGMVGSITIREMVTYVVISTGISTFISSDVVRRMNSKIRTGEIAMDLVKPFGLKANLFCESIGTNLFNALLVLVPLVGICAATLGIDVPSWQNLMLFAIALVNGLIVYFLVAYLLGLTGFWYFETWHLGRLLADVIQFLSGAWIPIWFFPPLLVSISSFLPFRLIYFVPISMYLDKVGLTEAIGLIFQQLAWIGILLAVERILWAQAVRKLVIQGG